MRSKTFYEVLMITKRDIALFKMLSNYGMLSTKQVGELVFNSIATTTVCRRLRLLETSSYVKRIRSSDSQDYLWLLEDRGAKLAEVEIPKRRWSKNMLPHDFKLLALRLALEGSGVAHSWTPEHEIRSLIFKKNGFRAAKEKLIPDGFMGVGVGGYTQSVAVELELERKSIKRYEEIFRRYAGKPDLHAIWYLAADKAIVNLVYKIWSKTKSVYRVPKLYVSFFDEVMKDPLNARLLGEEAPKLIGKAWTSKKIETPAHSAAQGVSTQSEKIEDEKAGLTAEDHTPISEDVA